MKFGLLLIMMAFASDNQENKVGSAKSEERFTENNTEVLTLVKIEEEEYTKVKKKTSTYIGVSYNESKTRWGAYRWSKIGKKGFNNGTYKDEETAAHASDTLARKLMANGEQNFKLNFPDDHTEVFHVPEKKKTSKYIGVCYNESYKTWSVHRWSNKEKIQVFRGDYKDEETAAHASDTLARQLMANCEQNLKLNFPDDHIEVHRQEKTASSKYIGVSYKKMRRKWRAYRHSKKENKTVCNGSYKNEEAAAHASDTLAKKLIANGEQNHNLNFPDDHTEAHPEEVKFSSIYIGVTYCKRDSIWRAYRWGRYEKKKVYNGFYKDEEAAAHASDALARKLMANGEKGHKLNFPDDKSENQKNKRKRSELGNKDHSQNK